MKNKLSLILGAKRINMSELCKATGISRTTINGLYHEKTSNPDMRTIQVLCDYLNITPNQFLGIDPLDY
ncbi:helix-turn-helix domain-containing protein [Macrococcus bovicus]|uniref:helix-turn-helix domain-containing protein n=1 Tax=Macrococcus bovicus TaxID=69968 RepID=UPI0025A609D0|nr:helix-turn-helix transcriptional regulator [Macrococcus bovicus]WJP98437.1 helix-turn-helix transcriptional regulator [Macrococcus bovicus]